MEWYVLALVASFAFGIGEVVRKKALTHEHVHQFLTAFSIIYLAGAVMVAGVFLVVQ